MHLVTVSNQVKCFDWPLGKLQRTYSPQMESPALIRNAAWANTAGMLCIVTPTGHAEVLAFDEPNSRVLHQVSNISNVNYAAFRNQTRRILGLAQSQCILTYDLKEKCIVKTFGPAPDGGDFTKLQFNSTDSFLCCSTANSHVYVYNTDVTDTCYTLPGFHKGSLTNFVLNDRGGLKVAGGTTSGNCIVWDVNGTTNIYTEPGRCQIEDLVFDQGNCLLYVTDDRRCVFRDYYNTATISELVLEYQPKCMDFCKDGIGFAICDDAGDVHAYDVRNLSTSINTLHGDEFGCKIGHIAFERYCNSDTIHQYDALANALSSKMDYRELISDFEEVPKSIEPVRCNVKQLNTKPSKARIESAHVQTEPLVFPPTISISLLDDIRQIIKDVIREELCFLRSDIKRNVGYAIQDSTQKNFMDLQLSLVKEFIHIEEIMKINQCRQ